MAGCSGRDGVIASSGVPRSELLKILLRLRLNLAARDPTGWSFLVLAHATRIALAWPRVHQDFVHDEFAPGSQ